MGRRSPAFAEDKFREDDAGFHCLEWASDSSRLLREITPRQPSHGHAMARRPRALGHKVECAYAPKPDTGGPTGFSLGAVD